ncbi:glycosyltransferase family 2 protein [Thioclava kandeliae]|uniref:Glycosyltransferase n=1 Tax=Thioclava kandeliae TaxID=3070818 RepID=A0ABV1SLI3_9RHOB
MDDSSLMITKDQPDISVIMPARNAALTIVSALRSILNQGRLLEVIVIDDGSRDNTAELVESLNDSRVRVILGPCSGISAALNTGFAAARGRYIARCDSDDFFTPSRLERQAAFLDAHPEFVAVEGGYFTVDSHNRVLAELVCGGEPREVTDLLRAGKVQSHLCTWLIRYDAIVTSGGAREWFQTAEDIDLQFRLSCLGRVWHMPEPMYRYRLHEGSITHGQKTARLGFFDKMAIEFLNERRRNGRDSLDLGEFPSIPDFSQEHEDNSKNNFLLNQILGHMTSQSWRDYDNGLYAQALGRMVKVVCRAPLRPAGWRGLAVMCIKRIQAFTRRH